MSLAINPQQPAAIANRGNALLALDRSAQALASYEHSLRLWPDYALAVYGRGNARREAQRRGVDPQRLVFAPSVPYPQHLARLRLADLCLDTFPFNGGTTTSDALWAGVPVVTCAGQSFAARMSGSLLHALHVPELVTHSPAEYEQRAFELALAPQRLALMRATIAHHRVTAPLFDTDRFRIHLEAAYAAMVDRHRQGLKPATFKVPGQPSAGP